MTLLASLFFFLVVVFIVSFLFFIPFKFFVERKSGAWSFSVTVFRWQLINSMVAKDTISEGVSHGAVSENTDIQEHQNKTNHQEALPVRIKTKENRDSAHYDSVDYTQSSEWQAEYEPAKNGKDVFYYILHKMVLNKRFRKKLITSIYNLVRRSTSLLKLRISILKCELGWDEPCMVGTLHGMIWAAVAVLKGLQPNVRVTFTPSFFEEKFNVSVTGTLRLYPGRFVWIMFLLVFEFPILAVVRLIRYVNRQK